MTEAVPTDPPHADGADDASSRMTSPGSVETALDTGSEAGAESSGGAESGGGADRERDVIAELAMLPAMRRAMLVGSLTTAERHELHDRWARWAHPGQHLGDRATQDDADHWRIWLILAGRGFGKTRAGAEWVSQIARDNPKARIALVGATSEDVRRVSVFDAPPVRGGLPYAVVDEPVLSDWSTKTWVGREGRVLLTLFDGGERPVRVRALLAAAEEGLEALPPDLGEGWRMVRLVLVRSRVLRVGDRWRGTSEFLVRIVVTTKDSGGWRQLLSGAGVRSVSVSGAGVFTGSAAELRVKASALSGVLDDYRLAFEGGDTMTGKFLVSRLDYAGDFNGERSYTLSLESSGAVVVG